MTFGKKSLDHSDLSIFLHIHNLWSTLLRSIHRIIYLFTSCIYHMMRVPKSQDPSRTTLNLCCQTPPQVPQSTESCMHQIMICSRWPFNATLTLTISHKYSVWTHCVHFCLWESYFILWVGDELQTTPQKCTHPNITSVADWTLNIKYLSSPGTQHVWSVSRKCSLLLKYILIPDLSYPPCTSNSSNQKYVEKSILQLLIQLSHPIHQLLHLRWTVDCFMFGKFVFIDLDGCFFWLCRWWCLLMLLLSFCCGVGIVIYI